MAAATTARLAIWSAIDNWSALNPAGVSVFTRKIRHDDDAGLLPANQPSGIGDLSVVEVFPLNENPEWQTHRMQNVPYTITVRIACTRLAKLEQLIEDTIKGIYQAAAPATPTMSYVRVATGNLPVSTQTQIQRRQLTDKSTGTKVWQADINVLIQFNRDPFA